MGLKQLTQRASCIRLVENLGAYLILRNGELESTLAGISILGLSTALTYLGFLPWQAMLGVWGLSLLLLMPNRTKQIGDMLVGWYRSVRSKDSCDTESDGN